MKALAWIIGAIFLAGVLVAGCIALVNDEDSMAPVQVQLVNHERSRCYEDGCYDGDRGDYSGDQNYDQWNNDQRNHNRRNRGAFSPGPFDDSPVTIIICPPGTQYCGFDGGRRDENPPPEKQRTRSEDVVCTLRNLPYHCDQKPEGT